MPPESALLPDGVTPAALSGLPLAADPFPLQETTLAGGFGGPESFLNADARSGIAPDGKPSDTIDQAAMQIIRGEPGWSGVIGAPATVTFAFRASAPVTMPDDTGGFTPFSTAQIDQALLALKAWSEVANITFVRVGTGDLGPAAYSNNAAILLGDYSTGASASAAFTYFPGSSAAASSAGDVWVNGTLSYNARPTVGNYGGQVLVHELGHAIGLDHPSNYDAAPGVTITYAADASYYEDSRQYTVMSYFDESNTGGNFGSLYSAAPLMDDIAAAQLEYGPNMATRTGDTVYGFHSNADEPWFVIGSASAKTVFAVWDAGGNDTFDFSGYSQTQTIDLRAGFFSSVGGLTGNVSIAQGVNIENAVGGSGADSITGNALANSLQGGAGADTIMAGGGNDTISGGEGTGYLRGEDGDDSIQGGSAFDDINGNKGDDTIDGGAGGGDWLVGGQGDDLIASHGSDDILYGNLGNDTLAGGAGNEVLRGGQGDDSLSGGAGADFISGDRGADTESGGGGADIFHGSQDAGVDKVLDFHLSEGDRVQLDPGTTYTLSQVGADTVIDMGGGNQMILVGVQLSTLSGNWIFES